MCRFLPLPRSVVPPTHLRNPRSASLGQRFPPLWLYGGAAEAKASRRGCSGTGLGRAALLLPGGSSQPRLSIARNSRHCCLLLGQTMLFPFPWEHGGGGAWSPGGGVTAQPGTHCTR